MNGKLYNKLMKSFAESLSEMGKAISVNGKIADEAKQIEIITKLGIASDILESAISMMN